MYHSLKNLPRAANGLFFGISKGYRSKNVCWDFTGFSFRTFCFGCFVWVIITGSLGIVGCFVFFVSLKNWVIWVAGLSAVGCVLTTVLSFCFPFLGFFFFDSNSSISSWQNSFKKTLGSQVSKVSGARLGLVPIHSQLTVKLGVPWTVRCLTIVLGWMIFCWSFLTCHLKTDIQFSEYYFWPRSKFFTTTTETSQNSSKWSHYSTNHKKSIDLCIRPL